jgi:hypothetical protein
VPELFDYEGRLFAIYDGSSGYVWKGEKGWQAISDDFAGRVWASGVDATGKAASYGADLDALPDA